VRLSRSILTAVALLTFLPTMAVSQTGKPRSPGFGHTFLMRGSIVSDTGGQLIACVGKADNAQAGQELTVYRTIASSGPRATNFQREKVGSVRIDQVINDHYALVSSIAGNVKTNDIVELVRP
jgi:hypothetical protein